MNSDSEYLAASGCFPCPVRISSEEHHPPTTAFPGFPDLNRGYFSAPMNAQYIPMVTENIGAAYSEEFKMNLHGLTGRVPLGSSERFLTMWSHEMRGHGK